MSEGNELLNELGRSGIRVLTGSTAWDINGIDDSNEAATTITVSGARMGDFVLVSSSLDVVDLSLVGQVTAANTVTVQFGNWTGGALDVTTPTIYVMVLSNPLI